MMNRRQFVSLSGLASLPLLTGFVPATRGINTVKNDLKMPVNMVIDGFFFNPSEYINILQQIEETSGINGDFYGNGGVVSQLEQEFQNIAGKEQALYLPTGTMANELALRLHCGDKEKIIVHSDSHVFMDENKSAERIHQKKLVEIANGMVSFSSSDLNKSLSDIGAITMENPVRRHSGAIVPLEDLRVVTDLARNNRIGTHLDGARIHLASAYSGIPIKDYASLFDSVYISLYKYLGASGGAILAGSSDFIEQVKDHVHPLGGMVFRSWSNAAVAHHFIKDLDVRLKQVVEEGNEIERQINNLDELEIRTIENGTNVAFLSSKSLNLETFADEMNETHNIWMNYPDNGEIEIHFNESLSQLGTDNFIRAVKASILKAR